MESVALLKVSEAPSRDVGKAVVRIDRRDMQSLGLDIGGIVEIRGKTSAYARAMPAYEEYRGRNLIQMDGILRKNAGVGTGRNGIGQPRSGRGSAVGYSNLCQQKR